MFTKPKCITSKTYLFTDMFCVSVSFSSTINQNDVSTSSHVCKLFTWLNICKEQARSVIFISLRFSYAKACYQYDEEWKGCQIIKIMIRKAEISWWSRNQDNNKADKPDHNRGSYSNRVEALQYCQLLKEKGDTLWRRNYRNQKSTDQILGKIKVSWWSLTTEMPGAILILTKLQKNIEPKKKICPSHLWFLRNPLTKFLRMLFSGL